MTLLLALTERDAARAAVNDDIIVSQGSILVYVHDARTGAPVRGALVRLIGGSARSVHIGRTNDEGNMLLEGNRCESGLLLVEAKGYRVLRQHMSCNQTSVIVDVPLEPALVEIGRTRSAPSTAPKATVSVSPESSVRRVNSTLVDALDQLAGLSARDRGTGFTAGIRGEDAAMTEYSLNGTPLGGGAASLSVNSDLLSSAAIDEANDALALFTASPTATPHYVSEFRLGSYENTLQRYQASGTFHGDGLGYVVVHTSRGLASELNGRRYLDESGMDYLHRGVRHTTGDLVRLSDSVGSTSASLTYSSSRMNAQIIPTYFGASLPAGEGPGTRQDSVSSNPVFFMSAPFGSGQLSLSGARWSSSTWTDGSSRTFAGNAAPLSAFSQTAGTDVTLSLYAVPTRNRAINASVSRTTLLTTGSSLGTTNGLTFGGSYARKSGSFEASIGEEWHGNARLPFSVSLKDRSLDQMGGALEVGVSAQYILSPRQRLRYTGTFGSKPVDLEVAQTSHVLDDPASAQFDCLDHAAFINGPGATSTKTHASNHDVTASLSGRRFNLTISVYQHAYKNVSIGSVPLVAGSLPDGYFPPEYLATVAQDYRSAAGCLGSLGPDHIFVQQAFAGANAVYRGASSSAHVVLSQAWSADINVGIERARVTAADTRLLATPFFPGSFVPGVANYKGSVIVAWQQRGGATAALLSTAFVGSHNSRQLPPYALVNAALERRLSPSSSATVLVSNLLNTLTDPFVSTRLALPLRDAYGRVIPTFASPLLPRRIEIRYTAQFGSNERDL